MTTTRVTRHIDAPRGRVYAALVDAEAVTTWKVPTGMTCLVHELVAREGGPIRVSLTYDKPGPAGKTTAHTDTYRGRFVRLVPDELVVEEDEFETDDPAFAGRMRISITLSDARGGGTDVVAVHAGVPPGVPPEQNEAGWAEALARLAQLVERGA